MVFLRSLLTIGKWKTVYYYQKVMPPSSIHPRRVKLSGREKTFFQYDFSTTTKTTTNATVKNNFLVGGWVLITGLLTIRKVCLHDNTHILFISGYLQVMGPEFHCLPNNTRDNILWWINLIRGRERLGLISKDDKK